MLYVTNETTGRSRFVERVYELPEPYRGSRQVHGTGSHLFLSVLANALPGHLKLTHEELMAVMRERREDACAALEARVKGGSWRDAGAHKLSELDLERVRFAGDEYSEPGIFGAWAQHNGIEYTLLSEHELRGGFDEMIEEKVLKEGAKMSELRWRIISWQVAHAKSPLAVGAKPPASEGEEAPEEEKPQLRLTRGAAAAAELCESATAQQPVPAAVEMSPAALTMRHAALELVKRRVLVYWAGEDTWFAGVVTSYSQRRGHQIAYDDGTFGSAHLSPGHEDGEEWPWRLEGGDP